MIAVYGFYCLAVSFLTANDTAAKALERGDQALARAEYDTALVHYDEAIKLSPRLARAYHGRGVACFHKQQYGKAIASYTDALKLEPKNDVAFFDRGLTHWHNAEGELAVQDFKAAVALNPKNDFAYNGLAWALSTSTDASLRDGKRAVEFAKKACELTDWKNPFHLSALAAAYAEVGDFKQAIRWHKQAMDSPQFPKDRLERARERLRLFEEGKPYRETTGKK